MKYKAFFSVKYLDFDEELISQIPVSMMAVDGGTARLIDFRSTDDISLISEFEQARSLKNMIVYLAATKGNADARAVYELTNLGNTLIEVILVVERFSGGKLLEGVAIYGGFCTVKYPPIPALDNTFVTTISLSQTELFRGKITKHTMPKVTNF